MNAALMKCCCCSAPNSALPYRFDETQGRWVQDATSPGKTSEVSVWAQTPAMGIHAAMGQPASTGSSDGNGALLGKVLGSTLGFVVVASLGRLAWRKIGQRGADNGCSEAAIETKAPRRLSLAFMDVSVSAHLVCNELQEGPPRTDDIVFSEPCIEAETFHHHDNKDSENSPRLDLNAGEEMPEIEPHYSGDATAELVLRPVICHTQPPELLWSNTPGHLAPKPVIFDARDSLWPRIVPTEYLPSQHRYVASNSAQLFSDLVIVDEYGSPQPHTVQAPRVLPNFVSTGSFLLPARQPFILDPRDSHWPRIIPTGSPPVHDSRGHYSRSDPAQVYSDLVMMNTSGSLQPGVMQTSPIFSSYPGTAPGSPRFALGTLGFAGAAHR